jgi:cellulose synthase/poly-beta-1,6-N-acetylglucosamine synthase-like glycosyltransferase
VSVIIATRESDEVIEARVRNLLDADYPGDLMDVVVGIDRRPVDSLVARLALIGSNIRVVPSDAPGGKPAALNAAVRHATGEVLVFADSYQRFTPAVVPSLAALAMHPSVGAVSGVLALPPGTSPLIRAYRRYENWLRLREAAWDSSIGVVGAVYAMRRELWRPLPDGLILDDLYTPMRLVLSGLRVVISPYAIALERRVEGHESEYQRKVRTLTGNYQLCVLMPRLLNPLRNRVWANFVFHKLLRLLTPYAILGLLTAGSILATSLLKHEQIPWLLASAAAGALLLAAHPRLRRAVRQFTLDVLYLQIAAGVLASKRALERNWTVWKARGDGAEPGSRIPGHSAADA